VVTRGPEAGAHTATRRVGRILVASLLGVAAAAGARAASARPPLAEPPPLPWRASTRSPEPARPRPDSAALVAACGRHDAALTQVASRVALRQERGEGLVAPDELAFLLRSAGEPHVWPRAFSVDGPGLGDDDVAARLARWSSALPVQGERRCGVAEWRRRDGTRLVAAVAVDAIADLDPLPTIARTGRWLTLTGQALVPAREAKVVLLGPTGAPRSAVASIDERGRIRSSFVVDRTGRWLVQVLLTTPSGPRPALEAYVFAGGPPPSRFTASFAPGEGAADGARDDVAAMRRMMDAARATEGLAPLAPDPTLDRLAREHVARMIRSNTLGHDVGGGDPARRMRDAGLRARAAGENVAVAATVARAHRALWNSPSHRGNLLDGRFRRAGVHVGRGDDGRAWAAILFAD
jgi:uncharacterized protein YkwD